MVDKLIDPAVRLVREDLNALAEQVKQLNGGVAKHIAQLYGVMERTMDALEAFDARLTKLEPEAKSEEVSDNADI